MKITCPNCKTVFLLSRGNMGEYVYKINGKYYCCYTCWRKHGGDK